MAAELSWPSYWLANGLILGSIFVLGPANDLHMTGTIFFFPVTVFVITCCLSGYAAACAPYAFYWAEAATALLLSWLRFAWLL